MIMDLDSGTTPPPPHNQPLPVPPPASVPSSSNPQATSAAQPLPHSLLGPPCPPDMGISPGQASAAALVAPNGPNEAAPAPAVSHREGGGAAPGAEVMSPNIADAMGQGQPEGYNIADDDSDEPMWEPTEWMIV